RAVDFDNSPNKTFTYNPSTLNMRDSASTQPTASYPYTTGSGSYTTFTPLEILTKSAAAATKADCYTAFPQLTTSAPALAKLGSTDRTNAVNTRTNELVTCLNQWNDYTPSLVRNIVRREIDKRQDLDLRADFKVNNELTVYAKGSYQKRTLDNNQLTYGLGGVNVNTANSFVDANGVRAVTPAGTAAGYYLYPGTVSAVSGQPAVTGAVVNVDPKTVVVDASHHVTQATIGDGVSNPDQVHTTSSTVSKYFQLGGTWKHENWSAEFFVGDAKSDFLREDKRVSYSYVYGPATMSVTPQGLWTYNIPGGVDEGNAAKYAYLTQPVAAKAVPASPTVVTSVPAYTQAQQPLLTQAPQLSYTPRLVNTDEK
ncbi:MAG: hypothetical protein JF615_16345, partial [Asticcacaulis sp.]|nr:hypothetical protein [Asticcacaulis sp.]